MPDVAKLKKRALEYEQKKQFDKALDTYTLVLAELDEHVDEADVALYNRVGDLLLRRGDVSEAVDHYEKAVDLYTDGGFFNNAIALCNKILRNAPGRNSVYYKLGKISARKGFINDAKQNFLEYADRMQKSGHLEEAFRALKEFADLCPDQTDIRLMLADQLVRKDRKSEAIEQLHALYEKFSAEGRSAEARATVDRMKALDPDVEPKEVVRPTSPKGGDLIFLDVNYDEPARSIAAPSTASKAPGSGKTAWTVVSPTAPPVPPAAPPESPAPPAAPPASPVPPAAPQAVAIEMPLIDPDEEIVIDLDAAATSTDVPPLPGLSHGAILADGDRAAGDGIVSHIDLGLITGFENTDTAVDDEAGRDIAPLAELEDQSYLVMPDSAAPITSDAEPSIPSMLDELQIEQQPSIELNSIELDDEIQTASDLPMLDVPLDEEDERQLVGEGLTFINTLDVEQSPSLEMDPDVPDGGPPLPMLEMDERDSHTRDMDRDQALSGLPMLEAEPDEEPADAHASPFSADEEVDEKVELVWQTEPADAPPAAAPEPAGPPPSRADQLRRALLQTPSAWDLHRQLAEALLEEGDRAGGMMELEATMFGYEREGNLAAASRSANELIRVEPDSVRYHQKRVEYAVRANDKSQLVDAYLALAESLFRSGQLDKSRAVYGRVLELSPSEARATSAIMELGAELELPPAEAEVVPPRAREPVAASTDESFVNLADWMREDEAPKNSRTVVQDSEEQPDDLVEFGDMLAKFKQGVTSNVDETDHESHYDLGIAYKEMGLLDEAISEFQKALRGTEQRVRTYEALGQCFVEKRQYQIAMTILLRALNDANTSDDTLVGVLYLLGYASESLQKWGDAVRYYERVFTVDIQFRDVGDRLATVERKAR